MDKIDAAFYFSGSFKEAKEVILIDKCSIIAIKRDDDSILEIELTPLQRYEIADFIRHREPGTSRSMWGKEDGAND